MILVADSNRVTAEMLVRRLRADGFEADAASHATAVAKRINAGGIEALILDPNLPDNGLKLIERLRATDAGATLPVIVFGTSDRVEDTMAAARAGATATMVKGRVTPNELVAKLRSVLTASRKSVAPPIGSYYLWVDTKGGDASRLARDVGAAPEMCCIDCGCTLSLFLQRDASRWGKWLFATFGCLVCAKKRGEGSPIATISIAETIHHEETPMAAGSAQ